MSIYRDSVINALLSDYILIYEVDVEKDYLHVIYETPEQGTFGMEREGNYTEFHRKYTEERVDKEFYEARLAHGMLENLKKELTDKDRSNMAYTVNYGKWRSIEYIVAERDPEGTPTLLLFCFRRLEDDSADAFYRMVESEKSRLLVEESLKEAQQAADAKTAFLSNMSRNIRTPMNSIMGNTQLALAYTQDLPDVQDYLKDVMAASRELVSMMDNLLEVTRLESGRIHMVQDREDLSAILNELQTIMKPQFEAHDIEFRVDLLVRDRIIICDRGKLIRILKNILQNSLNATKPGGLVTLSIVQQENSSSVYSSYEFFISDNGVGMTPEFLKIAFDPFTREQSSGLPVTAGAGLGLPLTKQLLSSMGGKIALSSEQNVGTKCTISIDFKAIPEEDPEEKKEPAPEHRGISYRAFESKRFLVVGETTESLSEVTDILIRHGASLEAAANANDAVAMVMRSEPFYYDAVLMDVRMEGLDGLEATRRIRQLEREELSHIPVLLVNTNMFGTDRVKAKRVGVDDFVTKPVTELELVRKLKGVML